MPAIADQVTNLEHDHIAALAQIDALNARNAALMSENTALNKYADEIKAMVESVATGALHMLQAARAPIVAAVEKEVAKVVAEVKPLVLDVAGFLGPAPVRPAATDAIGRQLVEPVQGDSGDEQPEPATATPAAPIVPPANILETIETAALEDVQAVEAKIADIPDAVERMLHHSSASSAPPTTSIRRPVDLTMHVEHDPAGLPIFLRRGTAFEAMTRGIDA